MLIEAAAGAAHSRTRTVALSIALAAVALVAFVARPGEAKAGLAWCASDPIISVNGQQVSIWINVPLDKTEDVKEAVIEVHVPKNVDAKVVFVDQSLFPEKVVIKKDLAWWKAGTPLIVKGELYVDDDGRAFPVGAEVVDATGSHWIGGYSDQDIPFLAQATR